MAARISASLEVLMGLTSCQEESISPELTRYDMVSRNASRSPLRRTEMMWLHTSSCSGSSQKPILVTTPKLDWPNIGDTCGPKPYLNPCHSGLFGIAPIPVRISSPDG